MANEQLIGAISGNAIFAILIFWVFPAIEKVWNKLHIKTVIDSSIANFESKFSSMRLNSD